MGSRIREDAENFFEVFTEIARPVDSSQEPFVLQKFPEDYDDQEVLNSIPKFAFPCDTDSSNVDHFTFVQTDIESKFKFGFCRHGTGAHTCLCIISCLPWFEVFYRLLNELAEILNRTDSNNVVPLLTALYAQEILAPGSEMEILSTDSLDKFSYTVPDIHMLPRIPESRNLTEYYNAIDHNNMMVMFASMLFERRIIITSRKLSRLTACIHGSAALLYPMHWQHLYIPVLPVHLLDYCSAPMPFLIGLHSSQLETVKQKQDLGDAIILNADTNTLESEHDDLADLPSDVVSSMKKRLKALQAEKMKGVMGDGVSRVFLKSLVSLIGGYRDALKFRPGEQISFDPEAFVQSRPANMQPFLESMLHLQIFEQFVNDRLDILNAGLGFSDEFEVEANMLTDKSGSQSKYKEWLIQAKRQGRKLRREGKERWVDFTSKFRDKSKKAYKDLRSKMDSKKDEEGFGPNIVKSRPATLPSPKLRAARPPRPPPPDVRSPLAEDPLNQQSKGSYERRSRQYKVLALDDLNGDDSEGAQVSRRARTSQDDDMTYTRVSIDLMNDADIQQVFKKSYSFEDLQKLTSPTIPDIEEAEDALLMDESVHGYHSLMSVPMNSPASQQGVVKHFSSMPSFLTKQNRTDHLDNNIRLTAGLDTSKFPVPAPRRKYKDGDNGTPLINLDTDQDTPDGPAIQISTHSPTSQPIQDFDPFLQNTEDARKSMDNQSFIHAEAALEDNNNDISLTKCRSSISRHNAFYNIQRPPSVKRRPSPTPQATDSHNIKEARTAFLQSEITKPLTASVSHGLDQFDPLLTGQLAVDNPPVQLASGGSRSSGSSVDTGISAGSRTQSTETMHAGNQEDNLLKEWNLDFAKVRISSATKPSVAPPPVPPKPNLPPLGQRPGYISPVHARSGTAGSFPMSTVFPPQQVVGATTSFPQPVVPPVMWTSSPGSSSLSNVHLSKPTQDLSGGTLSASQALPQQQQQQQQEQQWGSAQAGTSPRASSPFGPLDQLMTPGTQARPASLPGFPQQERGKWETFE